GLRRDAGHLALDRTARARPGGTGAARTGRPQLRAAGHARRVDRRGGRTDRAAAARRTGRAPPWRVAFAAAEDDDLDRAGGGPMSRAGRQEGFTLVELMGAVALSIVLVYAIVDLTTQAQRTARAASDGGGQLDGFRNAMSGLAADLRRAQRVRGDGDSVVIDTAEGACRWSVAGSELLRADDGGITAVAGEVRRLTVSPAGPAWQVELEVGRRSRLRTTVAPRVGVPR